MNLYKGSRKSIQSSIVPKQTRESQAERKYINLLPFKTTLPGSHIIALGQLKRIDKCFYILKTAK